MAVIKTLNMFSLNIMQYSINVRRKTMMAMQECYNWCKYHVRAHATCLTKIVSLSMRVAAFLVVVAAVAVADDSEELEDVLFRYVLARTDCDGNLKFKDEIISDSLTDWFDYVCIRCMMMSCVCFHEQQRSDDARSRGQPHQRGHCRRPHRN